MYLVVRLMTIKRRKPETLSNNFPQFSLHFFMPVGLAFEEILISLLTASMMHVRDFLVETQNPLDQ